MSHPQLDLSNDELLSTTRAVRKRLDFDREVEESVLMECLELAVQAPTGSNAQGWQFVLERGVRWERFGLLGTNLRRF